MDSYAIQTVVQENGENISTIIDAPIEVTSVNGMTGDVQVEPKIEGFLPNHYYTAGTAITYNGKMYIASSDFTSGNSFNIEDWASPGFAQEQADWTETDVTANSFIRNKTSIEFGTESPHWVYSNTTNEGTNLTVSLPSETVGRVDVSFGGYVSSVYTGKLVLGANSAMAGTKIYTHYFGYLDGTFTQRNINYTVSSTDNFGSMLELPSGNWGAVLYHFTLLNAGHPRGSSGRMWFADGVLMGEDQSTNLHITSQITSDSATIAPGPYLRYSDFIPTWSHREGKIWLV